LRNFQKFVKKRFNPTALFTKELIPRKKLLVSFLENDTLKKPILLTKRQN